MALFSQFLVHCTLGRHFVGVLRKGWYWPPSVDRRDGGWSFGCGRLVIARF